MNKVDLAQKVAEALGVSKSQAEQMVNVLLDTIMSAVKRDDSVVLTGFGTFTVMKRKSRIGINPATGKRMNIPSKTTEKPRIMSAHILR